MAAALSPTKRRALPKRSFRLRSASAPAKRLATIPEAYRDLGYAAVYEKDVLRIGKWQATNRADEPEEWDVDDATLKQISTSFATQRTNGVRSYLTFDHTDKAVARKGDVLAVFPRGETLVTHIGVKSPKTAQWLDEHDDAEVSIDVDQGGTDGAGRRYPWLLRHVAIVQHPVVHSQGPFKRLLSRRFPRRRITLQLKGSNMADEETTTDETTEEGDGSATEIAVSKVVTLLADYFGVKLPDGIDTEKELKIALAAAAGEAEEEETEATDDETAVEELDEELPDEESGVSMSRTKKKAKPSADAKKLAAKLAAKDAENRKLRLSMAKRDFVGRLNTAMKKGRITPATRSVMLEAGKATGYRLSLLDKIRELPEEGVLPVKKKAKAGASNKPKGSEKTPKEMTDDRAKEIAKSLRGG